MNTTILFPGQGSQYINMCSNLEKDFLIVRQIFEEANESLGFNIKKMIETSTMEELTRSENAQPAIIAASYAFYKVFEQLTGVKPDYAAGHSLGEISALIAAGAMSFKDGIVYARKRGQIMAKAAEGKRGRAGVVIDVEENKLREIIEDINKNDYVIISGYNSPKQFIVAGTESAVLKIDDKLDEIGAQFIPFRMIPMKADAPYHTELMAYLKEELESILSEIKFKGLEFKIYSTVTGSLITERDNIGEILSRQLISPIKWNQAVDKINNSGTDLFIDIGPKTIMRNLMRENSELKQQILAFDDKDDRKSILDLLK